jgi:hypothetical protein
LAFEPWLLTKTILLKPWWISERPTSYQSSSSRFGRIVIVPVPAPGSYMCCGE